MPKSVTSQPTLIRAEIMLCNIALPVVRLSLPTIISGFRSG